MCGEVSKMKRFSYFAAALIAGIALSTEAAIGGALGERIGEIETSLFVFLVGVAAILPFILISHREEVIQAFRLPKWELAGGFLGGTYLVLLLVSVNMVGVGISMIAVIIGQMITSIVIDHFGWLGIPKMKFNKDRLTAAVLLICALILIS